MNKKSLSFRFGYIGIYFYLLIFILSLLMAAFEGPGSSGPDSLDSASYFLVIMGIPGIPIYYLFYNFIQPLIEAIWVGVSIHDNIIWGLSSLISYSLLGSLFGLILSKIKFLGNKVDNLLAYTHLDKVLNFLDEFVFPIVVVTFMLIVYVDISGLKNYSDASPMLFLYSVILYIVISTSIRFRRNLIKKVKQKLNIEDNNQEKQQNNDFTPEQGDNRNNKKYLATMTVIILVSCVAGFNYFYQNSDKNDVDEKGVDATKTSNETEMNYDTIYYKWNSSISAPKGYPSEFINAKIYFSDESWVGIPPNNIINPGWGDSAASYVMGDTDVRLIPDKFITEWFSYADNSFYSGEFILDKARINELFQEGFLLLEQLPDENATFDGFTFGIAPGGDLAIWLSGRGVRIEVGAFKASKVSDDWTRVTETEKISRTEYIDLVLSERLTSEELYSINNSTDYIGKWGDFSNRFLWEIKIDGISASNAWVSFVNGERVFLDDNLKIPFSGFESKSAPKSFMIDWESQRGNLRLRINFDDDKIYSIISDFSEKISGDDFQLVIQVDEKKLIPEITIVSGDIVLPITDFTHKVTRIN